MCNVKEISHFIARAECIDDPYKKKFALSMIQFMQENGIETINALSEKLQVTRQTLSYWITGVTLPDGNNLVHISEITGYSFDKLLGKLQARNHPEQFASDYTLLSPKAIKIIRENRELYPHRPFTNKDVKGVDLDLINAKLEEWDPNPKQEEIIDYTNVKFLNALIEAHQFQDMYEWFQIFREGAKEYKNDQLYIKEMKKISTRLSPDEHEQYIEEVTNIDNTRRKVKEYREHLLNVFADFLDDQIK